MTATATAEAVTCVFARNALMDGAFCAYIRDVMAGRHARCWCHREGEGEYACHAAILVRIAAADADEMWRLRDWALASSRALRGQNAAAEWETWRRYRSANPIPSGYTDWYAAAPRNDSNDAPDDEEGDEEARRENDNMICGDADEDEVYAAHDDERVAGGDRGGRGREYNARDVESGTERGCSEPHVDWWRTCGCAADSNGATRAPAGNYGEQQPAAAAATIDEAMHDAADEPALMAGACDEDEQDEMAEAPVASNAGSEMAATPAVGREQLATHARTANGKRRRQQAAAARKKAKVAGGSS